MRDIRCECSRRALSLKHEVRVMQAGAAEASSTSPRPGRGCVGGLCLCWQQARRRRHHQVSGAQIAKSGIRVNAVARSYGPRHVDPFHGHAGEQSRSGDGCSDGSPRSLENLPARSCSSRRTMLHSSPAISSAMTVALRWQSGVVKRYSIFELRTDGVGRGGGGSQKLWCENIAILEQSAPWKGNR